MLRIPVEEDDFDSWLKSERSLFYPYVSDLPGPEAWDDFACSFIKKEMKDAGTDVLIFSELQGESKILIKRINFLLKSIGIKNAEIITNKKEADTEHFYKDDLGYILSCSQTTSNKNKYKEVNLYVRDYEVSEKLADYVIQKFSLTTVIHDLYSS